MTLPTGWTSARLSDITEQRVKQGPPGGLAVNYIDIGSIDRDAKRIGLTEKIDSASAPTRARQWVQTGDVLVSMTRPNLNAVALVTPDLDGAVASTGFDVLRAVEVLPEWVFYRVRSHEFVQDVCQDIQGVVYPAIRPDDVRRHVLPVPPFAEQRRIADAVDSYLSRLDVAVASLDRAQTRLKAYRASVLKAAVEGRLVPTEAELARAEKRDYEPADVLLKRILAERRRRWEEAELAKLKTAGKTPKDDEWKAKYEDPAIVAGTLPELPAGWCWSTLEQLLILLHNGQSKPPREEQGVRVLRISAVRPLTIDFADVRYLPGEPQDYEDDLVSIDDLLFTRYNGTRALVGVCARVRNLPGPTLHPDKLIKVRLAHGLSPSYVEIASNVGERRRHVESRSRTTAGQSGISGGDLRQMPVPLPPYAEQLRIADAVEDILSVVEATSGDLDHALQRCARLRQSTLKWAFEGKLVDQDPNDEPAEKLLERIRAARTAGVPRGRTTHRRSKATG